MARKSTKGAMLADVNGETGYVEREPLDSGPVAEMSTIDSDAPGNTCPQSSGTWPTVEEIGGALAHSLNQASAEHLGGNEDVLGAEPYRSVIDWKLVAAHGPDATTIALHDNNGGTVVVAKPSVTAPWQVRTTEPNVWLTYRGSWRRLRHLAGDTAWRLVLAGLLTGIWWVLLTPCLLALTGWRLLGRAYSKGRWRRDRAVARRDLKTATEARQEAITSAEGQLRQLERTRGETIADLERKIDELNRSTYLGEPLATLGSVSLYEYGLRCREGWTPLSGLSATVTMSGSISYTGDLHQVVKKRPTLTRMVVGTALAGPAGLVVAGVGAQKKKTQTYDSRQTHDDRKLLLTIDAPKLFSEISFPPSSESAVRSFASKINNGGRQASTFEQDRAGLIERFTRELERNRLGEDVAEAQRMCRQVAQDTGFLGPIQSAEDRLHRLEAIRP